MKKENLLIVCFDIKDLKKIYKLNLFNYDNVIVASDDFRVHEECEKLDFVYCTTFLQRIIPYTNVADNVIEIINKINLFNLHFSQKNYIYNYKTLEWVCHVEGGESTQKIQDLLLYLESIDSIVYRYNIKCINVIINFRYDFVSNIILLYTDNNGIIYKETNYKRFFKYLNIKEIIRTFYSLLKIIYIKIKYKKNLDSNNKNIALFWLFNSEEKHLNNAIYINSLLKKAKYMPLAYSWRVNKIENSELNIQRIESFISWNDIFMSIKKRLHLLISKNRIKLEFNKYNVNYKNIDLNKIVFPLLFKYMMIESSDSYIFSCGFKKFVENLDVKMMSGDLSSHRIGNIVESLLPVVQINKFAMTTFLTGKNVYYEYRMKKYSINYLKKFSYFVQNIIEKNRILEQINIDSKNVVIYGSGRIYKKVEFSKSDILKKYNILKKHQYIILFDYSNFLFGYQSINEIFKVINSLIKKFEKNQDVCLLIKPHPSADMILFNSLEKKYMSENIQFLKKTDNINELLFVSDILISKYSTVGIEAIKYDVLVISPQLCGSDYFKLYGEFAFYKYSIEMLTSFLDKLFKSRSDFLVYKKIFVKKTQNYINDFYLPLDESIIVETLKGEK